MPTDSPRSLLSTSSVYCLVFPHPHPSTWKDGLYKVRDYLNLTTWANRCSVRWETVNYSWETVVSCYRRCMRALVTWARFQAPNTLSVSLRKSSSTKYRTRAFYHCRWVLWPQPHMRVAGGKGGESLILLLNTALCREENRIFMQTICSKLVNLRNLNDFVLFSYQEKFSRPFTFREKQFSSAIFSTSADHGKGFVAQKLFLLQRFQFSSWNSKVATWTWV